MTGKFRIRLSSIEPAYVNDELIEMMRKSEKLCKHLHMPLQSADERILRLMKRNYSAARFLKIVKRARKKMPDMALNTDLLAGFPGENEKAFNNTVKFIQLIRPSRLHVFSYSPRPGTGAQSLGGAVGKVLKRERVHALRALGKKFSIDFARTFIGKKDLVLVESEPDRATGYLTGYTDRYVRVLFKGPDSLKGKLASVVIKSIEEKTHAVFADIA